MVDEFCSVLSAGTNCLCDTAWAQAGSGGSIIGIDAALLNTADHPGIVKLQTGATINNTVSISKRQPALGRDILAVEHPFIQMDSQLGRRDQLSVASRAPKPSRVNGSAKPCGLHRSVLFRH